MENYTQQFDKAIEHLQADLKAMRSGRATPALVENIPVESYGTKMPLKQLANIHTPEPRLLVIEPWDKSLLKEVEKAVAEGSVNLTPNNDGNVIRIQIPPLTEETRRDIIKILHQKLEGCRISIRKIREDVMKELKNQKEKNEISEDDYFKQQKQVQEDVDRYNDRVKVVGEQKEKEIMTV